MELLVKRTFKGDTYTIGNFYINGKFFCNTIEDKDRGLASTMTLEEIKRKKIHGQTAIPTGTYKITLNIVSSRFNGSSFFRAFANGGKLPRLLNVKGFDGVLIHTGNTEKDTDGCIVVGENKVKGKVINSKNTFRRLYPILAKANKDGEDITITIQ